MIILDEFAIIVLYVFCPLNSFRFPRRCFLIVPRNLSQRHTTSLPHERQINSTYHGTHNSLSLGRLTNYLPIIPRTQMQMQYRKEKIIITFPSVFTTQLIHLGVSNLVYRGVGCACANHIRILAQPRTLSNRRFMPRALRIQYRPPNQSRRPFPIQIPIII